MKCVKIKDIKEFEVSNVEEPISNGTDVIVDVKLAGICGSDIHYWDIGNPKGLVMGHEFCGIVTDCGNRNDLKVGDRVTALPISPCGECHACKSNNPQYCIHTWDKAVGLSLTNPGAYALKTSIRSDMVIKVPNNISDDEVAMVEPSAVALHAVNLANIKPADKVLVIGAGIIGQLSCLLSKLKGASYVAVSEANVKRGEKCVKLGAADEFIYALDENFASNATKECPEGYDIVIECCGNSAAVNSALTVVKTGGTVILVGVSLNPINYASSLHVTHELKVIGAIAYTKEEFSECIQLMSSKKIDVKKFVDDIVSLDDVQASYERLTSGTDDAIKILIDPNK